MTQREARDTISAVTMNPDQEYRRGDGSRPRCCPHGLPLLDPALPVPIDEVPAPAEDAATWRGLASAVALTSARLGGLRVGHADIARDVPGASVLGAAPRPLGAG